MRGLISVTSILSVASVMLAVVGLWKEVPQLFWLSGLILAYVLGIQTERWLTARRAQREFDWYTNN